MIQFDEYEIKAVDRVELRTARRRVSIALKRAGLWHYVTTIRELPGCFFCTLIVRLETLEHEDQVAAVLDTYAGTLTTFVNSKSE